jgi:hypothetical protein
MNETTQPVPSPPPTEPGVPVPDTDPPEEGEKYDGGSIPRVENTEE